MNRALAKIVLLVSAAVLLGGCASTASEPDPAPGNVFEEVPTAETAGSLELSEGEALALAETAAANPEEAVAEVDPDNVKRCTKEVRTGSRIPKKYCRTKREDDLQREAGKAWIKTIQDKPRWTTGNN